jgi:hypothetical protein
MTVVHSRNRWDAYWAWRNPAPAWSLNTRSWTAHRSRTDLARIGTKRRVGLSDINCLVTQRKSVESGPSSGYSPALRDIRAASVSSGRGLG